MKFKKFIFFVLCIFVSTSVFAETLKIGIIAGPSEKLIKDAAKIALDKYNIEIQPVVFTDYLLPNEALNSGEIDANLFQTREFLDASITAKKYKIKQVANTFIYPMGIYSKKIKKRENLKDKSTVIIPNDASNQSRALILLKNAGLFSLKEKKVPFFTPRDIINNERKLKIVSMNATQIARSVSDATLVVLNNDFVLPAGFSFQESLFSETTTNAEKYINVLVVRNQKENNNLIKFIGVLHSKEYELETYKYYPNAIVAW